MKVEAHAQKNTLLKTAASQPTTKVFKRVFFSPTQEEIQIIFFPTLRCFNFFSNRTVRNWTDSASILGGFGQSVSKLDTTHLQTDRRATDNKGFKKLGVQWLIKHLCFVSSSVVADSFVLRNPQLLKPPKRYSQW
ncbi:hypothetical protein [Daejeonella sp.]|uniref:hypothetical protein n=1 Tax=Daejeonella sp. TaxID=2805397 RepID=UPI00272F26B0|nr:hypothetical protein [Daejeonella sp.]MDP2414815.1 hypothetical protein [Daejeonella sp.]